MGERTRIVWWFIGRAVSGYKRWAGSVRDWWLTRAASVGQSPGQDQGPQTLEARRCAGFYVEWGDYGAG